MITRQSPHSVKMFIIFLTSLVLAFTAHSAPSSSTSISANIKSASHSSWRNITTSTASSQPAEHSQDGTITGPAYYLTTETSSYIQTETLNSGRSETVTLLDGEVTVEVGPAIFTDLNVETYVHASLYSTQTKRFHSWDPS